MLHYDLITQLSDDSTSKLRYKEEDLVIVLEHKDRRLFSSASSSTIKFRIPMEAFEAESEKRSYNWREVRDSWIIALKAHCLFAQINGPKIIMRAISYTFDLNTKLNNNFMFNELYKMVKKKCLTYY